MKIAPLAEVKDKFSAYIEGVKESPVIVTKNGKPVALISPISDEDDLDSLILANNPRFRKMLDDAWARYKQGKSMSSDAFWAEVRQRRKAQRTKT